MIKHAEGRRFLHKENDTFEAMQQEVSVTQKSTEVELWGVSLEIAGGENIEAATGERGKLHVALPFLNQNSLTAFTAGL